jgi:hypothetical protein
MFVMVTLTGESDAWLAWPALVVLVVLVVLTG